MTTLLETILACLVTGGASFLTTFHILKLKERKRLQDGYEHIESTLLNMYQALCECNGMGEQFKQKYEAIKQAEKDITGNTRNNTK